MNCYLVSQLARERQRDMLAQAGQHRPAGLTPAAQPAERAARRMARPLRPELDQ